MHRRAQMVQELVTLCEINSGSRNLHGLSLMHRELHRTFSPLADVMESIAMPRVKTMTLEGEWVNEQFGEALLVRIKPHLKHRVLLCGHMDTVYGPDNPFQTVTQGDDNTLNGPGVLDMKGGLVIMRHALMAFLQSPVATKLGVDVFINADEEVGSMASGSSLLAVAKQCQTALVFEPSMTPDGVMAKNRKGSCKITLKAEGVAAHAGRDFAKGRNAICFLASVLLDVDKLNGQREGLTLNVGLIRGGTSLNTVPDLAVAKIDVRLNAEDDLPWVQGEIDKIVKKHQKKDYRLTLDYRGDRPVKRVNHATKHLFSRLQTVAKAMPLELNWRDSGGCCDGNNISTLGLAVVDTLGARGGNMHTPQEFILLDSLVERATLTTLLLMDLAHATFAHRKCE